MAYNNSGNRPAYGTQQRSGNGSQQQGAKVSVGKTALFTTGLFRPDSEKSKALASIRVKEAVTIPAGSYINLYTVDEPKENGPTHRIQIKESSVKSK